MTRRRIAVALAAGLFAAWPALPQDGSASGAYYWPSREVGIPVGGLDQLAQAATKPTDVQLYVATRGGEWRKANKLPVDGLTKLGTGRGFLFTAPADGEYEFAAQFVYANGTATPPADRLVPSQRVVIDTVPPEVRVTAAGPSIEWAAFDTNLDPRGTTVEYLPAGQAQWRTVDQTFRTADRYAFRLDPGQTVQARVRAKDRAGNAGSSNPITLPAVAGAGAAGEWPPPRMGLKPDPLTAAGLAQPRKDYVKELTFDIDYTVQRVTRSGVKAVKLYVLPEQGGWEEPVDIPVEPIPFGTKEKALVLTHTVKAEGLYGFYVCPVSGANQSPPAPAKGELPMLYVEVDKTKPFAQITGVRVLPAGAKGPRVEVTWKADDRNLIPTGMSLEYSPDRAAAEWRPIALQIRNNTGKDTGRHEWEVPDDAPWKFWVRLRATDHAANVGEDTWKDEVLVDLEKPAAGIQKVRTGAAPPTKLP